MKLCFSIMKYYDEIVFFNNEKLDNRLILVDNKLINSSSFDLKNIFQ